MNRYWIIGGVGILLALVAVGLNEFASREANVREPTAAQASTPSLAASVAPAAPSLAVPPSTPAAIPPSFDVVRVNPAGDAVIAGRATPNAEVTVLDGDKPIGKVTADGRGEWVLLPTVPLAPGSRSLSLSQRNVDGSNVASERVVVLVVPERQRDIAGRPSEQPGQALALSVPRQGGGPSKVLQAPSPSGGPAPPAKTGSAPPGQAASAAPVVWRLMPPADVPPGLYTLRADRVARDGRVVARAELPLRRAAPLGDLTAANFVVIQPGNNLWSLARRVYGQGTQYTVIYQANQEQIRDPDLIYPGQVFQLPTAVN